MRGTGANSMTPAARTAPAPSPAQRTADRPWACGDKSWLCTGRCYRVAATAAARAARRPHCGSTGRPPPGFAYRAGEPKPGEIHMAWQPTTRLHVSGYRFLLRRLECALLRRTLCAVDEPVRTRAAWLALGCLLAAIIAAACAGLALLRPQPAPGDASTMMGQCCGALDMQVGASCTWSSTPKLSRENASVAGDVVVATRGRARLGPRPR